MPDPVDPPPPADLDRVGRYAPPLLVGRAPALARLDAAAAQVAAGEAERPRIVCLVAQGGIGKTALVGRWLARLGAQGHAPFEAAFAWSFHSQGSAMRAGVSTDALLRAALAFFGGAHAARGRMHPVDQARRLAHHLRARRALLVLDGLEPLQHAPDAPLSPGALKDGAMRALLDALGADFAGLCVITSRQALVDGPPGCAQHDLDRLPTEAGVALLTGCGVTGEASTLTALVDAVDGHALTLTLLARHLVAAHGGAATAGRGLLDAEAPLDGLLARTQAWLGAGPTADRQAGALLALMGFFERPATTEALGALLATPAIEGLTDHLVGLAPARLDAARARLEALGLLTVRRIGGQAVSQDAHPLVRAWAARWLAATRPAAAQAGHGRLFDWLCASAPEQPDSAEAMRPLHRAMRHGALADRHQIACDAVYYQRIQRGAEGYSTHKLGLHAADLAAISHLFETPWFVPSDRLKASDRVWLLGEAAFLLRALGRLEEALLPFRVSLIGAVDGEEWKNASTTAGNLANLYALLGQLDAARRFAVEGVEHADRSQDAMRRSMARTILGATLALAGEPAAAHFEAAERLQAQARPRTPTLYSAQGHRYCTLLLAPAERAAWRRVLGLPADDHAGDCQAVRARATEALRVATLNGWLVDTALDQLTLGQVELFEPTSTHSASGWLQQAVDGIRSAGSLYHIPPVLLARALCRAQRGQHQGAESAQGDLDEAWRIARTGSMALHRVDVHLHRARLFWQITPYPWESARADLAAARRLIEAHGYARRLAELTDAEQVISPV